jgi:hypothetical protein
MCTPLTNHMLVTPHSPFHKSTDADEKGLNGNYSLIYLPEDSQTHSCIAHHPS